MNSVFKYALSIALCSAFLARIHAEETASSLPPEPAAIAQEEGGNFADVPVGHWAYDAIENLRKLGILQGYPDTLYRGGRTATRYELAVAVHAAWEKLKSAYEGLEGQIKSLTDKLNSMDELPSEAKALRDQLAALQKDVESMKPWGEEIATLKKLAEDFKSELSRLGVDVAAMQKDLLSLEERVHKLEQRRHTVEISGDANVLFLAGHRGFDACGCPTYGVAVNGRVTGMGRGAYRPELLPFPEIEPTGMTRDLTVLHEAAFRFNTTNERGAKLQATLVAGNMLSPVSPGNPIRFPFNWPFATALGTQNSFLIAPFREGCTAIYFQDLKLMVNNKYGKLDVDTTLGRQGYLISPYIFYRTDYNLLYFKNPRWGNNEHTFDGLLVKLGYANAGLHLIGGLLTRRWASVCERDSLACVEINPINIVNPVFDPCCKVLIPSTDLNRRKADRFTGARIIMPFGDWGDLNFSYLTFRTDEPMPVTASGLLPPPPLPNVNPFEPPKPKPACVPPWGNGCDRINRMDVLGGEVGFNIATNTRLKGGYARTPYYNSGTTILDDDVNSFFGQIAYEGLVYGGTLGYRYVERNFNAPGSWGRIGLENSIRDVRGLYANLYYNVTQSLRLAGSGEFVRGITPLTRDNCHRSLIGRLDYQVTPNFSVLLIYEDVLFDYQCLNRWVNQNWFTVGTAWNLNKDATLYMGYHYGGTTNPLVHFNGLPEALRTFAGREFRGGLFYTNLLYKF